MSQEQDAIHQPPRRRRSRRPVPNGLGVTVVGAAEADGADQEGATPANGAPPPQKERRARERKRKVIDHNVIGSLFRKQAIEGTDLFVRDASMNDVYEILADEADAEINDREFVVRAVARQLAGDGCPSVADVREWSDEQLLMGARAMLSFPPLTVLIDGVERPPDPDDITAIPDPLTFAAFREAVSAGPKRRDSRLADTARRIVELGIPKMAVILDSGTLAAVRAAQSGPLTTLAPTIALSSSLAALAQGPMVDIAGNSPGLTMNLPDLDFTKGIAEAARGLTNTVRIAEGLSKLQATTQAAERIAKHIDFAMPEHMSEPIRLPAITPYHPEVYAIDALSSRIDAMAKNQAKADRQALEVVTAQSELIREQGAAVQGVISEVRGLRDDQRWPNRAVIIGAFLAGALLVVGVITAIPIVKNLFGL